MGYKSWQRITIANILSHWLGSRLYFGATDIFRACLKLEKIHCYLTQTMTIQGLKWGIQVIKEYQRNIFWIKSKKPVWAPNILEEEESISEKLLHGVSPRHACEAVQWSSNSFQRYKTFLFQWKWITIYVWGVLHEMAAAAAANKYKNMLFIDEQDKLQAIDSIH